MSIGMIHFFVRMCCFIAADGSGSATQRMPPAVESRVGTKVMSAASGWDRVTTSFSVPSFKAAIIVGSMVRRKVK